MTDYINLEMINPGDWIANADSWMRVAKYDGGGFHDATGNRFIGSKIVTKHRPQFGPFHMGDLIEDADGRRQILDFDLDVTGDSGLKLIEPVEAGKKPPERDKLPNFIKSDRFLIQRTRVIRLGEGNMPRDVFLAMFSDKDVTYPVCVVTIWIARGAGNDIGYLEWIETPEQWRRKRIATEVLKAIEGVTGKLVMEGVTAAGKHFVQVYQDDRGELECPYCGATRPDLH